MVEATLAARGWAVLPSDPVLRDWLPGAQVAADAALADPALSHWYECEGTWFVGVDALPNDAEGRLGPGPELTRAAWASHVGTMPPLHRGQLSVVWQGYPRPRQGEGAAALRYRVRRHAAHVDGLIPEGPGRRRFLREPHAFILGLPLNDAARGAAPLMVWEGSHHVLGDAFRRAFDAVDPADWPTLDVTEIYQAARRDVFAACDPVAVHSAPGEAILLHRHVLHGIGPWPLDVPHAPEGRRMAYFRPEFPGGIADWLGAAGLP